MHLDPFDVDVDQPAVSGRQRDEHVVLIGQEVVRLVEQQSSLVTENVL